MLTRRMQPNLRLRPPQRPGTRDRTLLATAWGAALTRSATEPVTAAVLLTLGTHLVLRTVMGRGMRNVTNATHTMMSHVMVMADTMLVMHSTTSHAMGTVQPPRRMTAVA
jgi:hypothetical protein